MKTRLAIARVILTASAVVLGLVLAGCSSGVGPADETDDVSWEDAPLRTSTLSIGTAAVARAARAISTGDRIYFRSSDIEFWSIGSVPDIGDLVSSKYDEVPDYAANHSLEYTLGDAAESIVFSLQDDTTVQVYRPDANPNWEIEIASFIAAGKTEINAMRLDVGAGEVTFVIDGQERSVSTASGDDANGINANSIFFVDKAFLSEPVLITRDIEQQVISGNATAASLGISEADFEVVQTLHNSSNWADTAGTPIDVNGALILPMTPVDISGFDASVETLDIVISWEIANAVHERDGEYFVDSRVGGTPFDFDVLIVRGVPTPDEPGDPTAGGAADHASRLEGSGISLDDYDVENSTTSGDNTWTAYGLKPSAGAGTSGLAFVQAVPGIWTTLPTMASVVINHGLPPTLLMVDTTDTIHVTFGYDTGSLYFGGSGERVVELRFSDVDQAGFSHGGVSVGSPIAVVTSAFGAPANIVHGEIEWVDQVLYVRPGGGGYIRYGGEGVRFFLTGADEASLVVHSMYLFEPEF